jgi:hypothetical protein
MRHVPALNGEWDVTLGKKASGHGLKKYNRDFVMTLPKLLLKSL